jgi:hypothetical protein
VDGDVDGEVEEEQTSSDTWRSEHTIVSREKLVEANNNNINSNQNNNNNNNVNNNSNSNCESEGETLSVMCGSSVRRKNRTISEELYENFVNKSDTNFDVCGSLEKLNGEDRIPSVVSSTDTLVNGVVPPSCGGDSCRICTHVNSNKK